MVVGRDELRPMVLLRVGICSTYPVPTLLPYLGNIYLFGIELTEGEATRFKDHEFIIGHVDNLSLLPRGNDLGTVVGGMVRSGSPSLHGILEESPSEDDSTSSDGGSSDSPIPQVCNMVTLAIPIVTTPPPEETPMLQTTPAVP
jgi:hypothetical protein